MIAVSTLATQLATLTAMAAVGGPLHLPTLVALTAPSTFTPTTTFADLVIATYDGYADEVGLVWGTPYIDVGGRCVMDAPGGDFILTGLTVTQTIVGMALVDAGKTVLHVGYTLSPPVPLTRVGQGFRFDPTFRYGE